MPYTYDGAGQPDYDGSEPEEPNQCELCGVYLDEDEAVVVRGDDDGDEWLCVCEACARLWVVP